MYARPNCRAPHLTALILATLLFTAACNSDDSNAVAPVATAIAVNAGSDAQSGVVGQALAQPVSVKVTDQNGDPMPNASVTWTVQSGAGTVDNATTTTDASGNTQVQWTLGTTAGANSLQAAIAGGTSVTINATGVAAAFASLALVSGDQQSVTAGSATAPLVVKAVDQYGNVVANVSVTWSTSAGTLSAATTTTGADGMTQVILTTDTAPGPYTVTATAGTATPITFTATGT